MALLANIVAVREDDHANDHALGRIVFWSLSGDITLRTLSEALVNAGSEAEPPAPVTAKVALHRAVEAVAKDVGCEAHMRKRGDWALVRRPEEQSTESGGAEIVYPVVASARVDGGALTVTVPSDEASDLAARIADAFDAAKGVLAPSDVGFWLCSKLRRMDALSLRESGGFYFIPQAYVQSWERIEQAMGACSAHRLNAIPAMRSQDAINAIFAAITTDTRKECDTLLDDLATGELGKRALETREKHMGELLGRLETYEGILGQRLDDLRAAIDSARAAVVTARISLEAEGAS